MNCCIDVLSVKETGLVNEIKVFNHELICKDWSERILICIIISGLYFLRIWSFEYLDCRQSI